MTGPALAVLSLAFSPDGHLLVVGDGEGTVHLWDMSDPARPTTIGTPLTNTGGRAMSLAFTPDGHTLAAAANGASLNNVSLWDPSDPRQSRSTGGITTEGTRSVFTVAFAADGNTLVTGGDSGTVRLGRPELPRSTQQPLTTAGPVWAVAFSPDGRTLAAALHAATALVRWDMSARTRPTLIGEPLTPSTGPLAVTAFSPDGRTLAATTEGGAVGLWSLDVEQVAAHVCATAGALDAQQRTRLVASVPYTRSC
ncbi:WD40 repeat domain-containing protein [Kitasatospora purpeofusca]|uniref:WD40 repeat domain-containing protein n=1 Tax=Kitasatospora purpeofusca TaxID=67352 RepID=UPI0036648A0D